LTSSTILFISTNYTWGGSEVLWSKTAAILLQRGYTVYVGSRYENGEIDSLIQSGAARFQLQFLPPRRSLIKRAFGRLSGHSPHHDLFKDSLVKINPRLVIISAGNNVDGADFMEYCLAESIPYVTVIQLVTEILWTFINDDRIDQLRKLYSKSIQNFFVSKGNLELNNMLMAEVLSNSTIVNNPLGTSIASKIDFPRPDAQQYNVAIVGRLETNHKGHDLLIQVLHQEKWKTRNIHFSFYGTGPHERMLKRLCNSYRVKNVDFMGQISNIEDIWRENQLLLLPSRMEGQSLALIEAMWCGRAAIVTNVGGASELIRENKTGFIAQYPDVTELDAAMERAWDKRYEWERMGIEAAEAVRELYKVDPAEHFANELQGIIDVN
jgi:glycosyltransferase involved in cell wall biosynthesis